MVRSDEPDRLTPAGWAALQEHGVATIIDLRNDEELVAKPAPRPDGVTTVRVPLDDMADREFWDHWDLQAPPLYYRPFLDRFPHRAAAVITAVARAPEGGVLVHCALGRDRTGLITLLLLALAGVTPQDIAADYALTKDRVGPVFAAVGLTDDSDKIVAMLAEQNTTATEVIASTLDSLDAEAYLRAAGVSEKDVAAVRARLL